ncbi:MAG: Ig-like domain-containing protein [Isosphaeraceae bacterium]
MEGRTLPASISISPTNQLFFGGLGENNSLTISLAGDTYTFNDSSGFFVVDNLGTAVVDGAGSNTVTVSGIVSINVDTGGGTDTINLRSTGVPTKLNTSLGDGDVVNVGSLAPATGGDLLGITADVDIDDSDTGIVNIDDAGDAIGRTVVFGEVSTRLGVLVTGLSSFTMGNLIQTLNFYAGTGDDVFTGASLLGSTRVNVLGGGGDDALIYTPDPLTPIASFDGGAGTNQIDYSLIPVPLPAGITVDLQAGTATFPPSIANIQQVVGTAGDDTLLGSDGPDTLSGVGGADFIEGRGGDDVLNAGFGNSTLIGGPGDDTVNGGGGDDLIIWNNGDGSDLINGGAGDNVVQVNGSTGATGDLFTLQAAPQGPSALQFARTNLNPFTLSLSSIFQVQVNGLAGDDTLILDFTNGNPIPAGDQTTPGVVFDGGAGTANSLVLQGTPAEALESEGYSAFGPDSGEIDFNDGQVGFRHVASTVDTVPVQYFEFSAPASAAMSITDGPAVGGLTTMRVSSGDLPAPFGPFDFASKQNATVDARAGSVVLDSQLGATGLTGLSIAGGTDTDRVTVTATPPGAGTFITLSALYPTVDVLGPGVAAGTTLTLVAGLEGFGSLTYDAAGGLATVTPGSGDGLITIAQGGAGSVAPESFEKITILNSSSPPTSVVSPPPTIDAVEGKGLVDSVVARFNASPLGDSGQYEVSIDWGDGSPVTAGSVAHGAANDSPYTAAGSHTFASPGTYTAIVTIRDGGGRSTTYVSGVPVTTERIPAAPVTATAATIVVAEAAIVAQGATVGAIAGQATGPVIVASFRDSGGIEALASYTATIDWGDGSPPTAGTLTAEGTSPAATTVVVRGAHTYTRPGVSPITVTITSTDGAAAVAHGAATVARPLEAVGTLTGRLDPRSDTGVSREDGITRDDLPTFVGTAGPGAIITLVATPIGGGAALPLGRAATDAAGNWAIAAPLIPDGSYLVAASGVGEDGSTASATLQTIVVDTVGPRVTSAALDRAGGRVVLGFSDDRSGLDGTSLINGANYAFTKVRALPGRFLVTGLTATPPSGLASTVDVAINGGRRMRGGRYTLVVRSGGVQDIAGNPLDGTFLGSYPSGDGIAGGNFVARLDSIHNLVYPPAPENSTASPPGGPTRAIPIPTGTVSVNNRPRLTRAWEAWRQGRAVSTPRLRAPRGAAISVTDLGAIRAGRPGPR